ncbi:sulfite exporter TauE/SafE family protein [Denitratisoma sp. agr-D3]
MDPLIVAALGLVTGLLLGLTGAGGGVVAAPLLMLVLHLPLTEAAPISLLAVALGAGLAMTMGLRQGVVRYRAALLMAALGLLASPLGIRLSLALPNTPLVLAFAALLVYQAWRHWYGQGVAADTEPPCRINQDSGRFAWNRPCAWALARAGLVAGFLSGLLGVGGGFVLVPALRRHTPLAMHAVTATSLMVLTLVSWGGIAVWTAHGAMDWPRALPFAGGTLAGIFLGRKASPRLAETTLQRAFALMCLTAGLALVAKSLLG